MAAEYWKEFKEIIEVGSNVKQFTLSITSIGNGSALYNNTSVRFKTTPFTVNQGTSATITFTPDPGYRIKSVKVNGTDVTSGISNSKYTCRRSTKSSAAWRRAGDRVDGDGQL